MNRFATVKHRVVRLVLGGAIGCHFFLLLLQVTPLPGWLAASPSLDPLFAVARYYRGISFANRNFRFFAPAVADDVTLSMQLVDATGGVHEYRLEGSIRELQLRKRAMLDRAMDSGQRMDSYARAWADYALRARPSAVAALVQVSRVLVPSMAQHRAGQRASSEVVYLERFARVPHAPSATEEPRP